MGGKGGEWVEVTICHLALWYVLRAMGCDKARSLQITLLYSSSSSLVGSNPTKMSHGST